MNEDEIMRRAQTAIGRFDSLRIIGAGWAGNSREGFQFNPESGLAGAAGTISPPVSATGACCPEVGGCFIATQFICEAGGGTYQGDDTTCDPNPCPTTASGACCVDSDCTIETEDECADIGGTYQGDDTECDPNPCPQPCNGCGFDAFDGSGRKFLTQTDFLSYVQVKVCDCGFGGFCKQDGYDGSRIITSSYDSDCVLTVVEVPDPPVFPLDPCPGNPGGDRNIDTFSIPCSPIVDSATQMSCSLGTTVDCFTCTNIEGGTDTTTTRIITLSDECIP